MKRKTAGGNTQYHYLTVNAQQKAALKAEAERRGESMAYMVRAALFGEALHLTANSVGVKDQSIGIRLTAKELDRLRKAAWKKGMHPADYERSRLFS